MGVLKILDCPQLASIDDDLWIPFKPGIDALPIYGEPATAGSSALLRYQPGAQVPEHYHLDVEHILVLSGSQTDKNGCHQAGSLVINGKGTSHSVTSHEGCIVLAVWSGGLDITIQ